MIFVILGTQKFQLNRLLKTLDELVQDNKITEEIIAQIGNSGYEPQNFSWYRFLDKEKFDTYIRQADLVITHSGVGSIITALNSRKPIIVFPRLVKYKEHVDDHQLDIARAFEKKNYVLCCYEEDDLIDLIRKSSQFQYEEYISSTEKMIGIIRNYLKVNVD